MTDVPKPDFLDRKISRRSFLIDAGLAAAGGASVLLFGGCTTKEQPRTPPIDRFTLPPTFQPETERRLPEINKVDIERITRRCVGDINKVLSLNLTEEETVSKVNLITDLKTYQNIIAEAEIGYQPTDEKGRLGITTDSFHSRGSQIFIYKAAIDEITSLLPANEQGIKAREDALESIINHEFAHWLAPSYPSAELHSLVYEKILANSLRLRGKKITPHTVLGAEVKARADGVPISYFQTLDEAEAFVIGDFVTKHRGRPQTGSFIKASDKLQTDLLLDFLTKLGPNRDDAIKKLAGMRREVGGREKYGRFIGEKFGIQASDQLFFGMSVLYAIDIGDKNLYERLVNRPIP